MKNCFICYLWVYFWFYLVHLTNNRAQYIVWQPRFIRLVFSTSHYIPHILIHILFCKINPKWGVASYIPKQILLGLAVSWRKLGSWHWIHQNITATQTCQAFQVLLNIQISYITSFYFYKVFVPSLVKYYIKINCHASYHYCYIT